MDPVVNFEQMEILRRLDACTLSNAIETFHTRLRNEGFVDNSIHCLLPQLPPMVGHAVTLKIRGSAPPTAAGLYEQRTDWWDYILTLPAPRVVVIQDIATKPGLGSLVGAVHLHILRALGCGGLVTNGAVRALPTAQQLGFPLFAAGISVSHAYVHIVEFGTPVEVGGLKVQSGDLLHGDLHGVQTIPAAIADKIPAAAAEIRAHEQELMTLCQSKTLSLETLREAFARRRS